MKTHQAEYKTDIAKLAENLARRDLHMLLAVAAVMALDYWAGLDEYEKR